MIVVLMHGYFRVSLEEACLNNLNINFWMD